MTDAELNDRLLELAGGCRHKWVDVTTPYGLTFNLRWWICAKCAWELNEWPAIEVPTAVGDGHQMTTDELLLLWTDTGGYYPEISLCVEPGDGWYASVGYPYSVKGRGEGDTPRLALIHAIGDAMHLKLGL